MIISTLFHSGVLFPLRKQWTSLNSLNHLFFWQLSKVWLISFLSNNMLTFELWHIRTFRWLLGNSEVKETIPCKTVKRCDCLCWGMLLRHTCQIILRKYYDIIISLQFSINHVSFNSILDLLNPIQCEPSKKQKKMMDTS